MKLWMVKFYLKEPKLVYKGMKTKRIGILSYDSEPIYETELEEKEINATIVASEEEADILVKGFTNDISLTRAEKIELLDNPKIMGSTIKEVYIDEVVYDNK